jgi:Fe-S-cluster-containing dehydrogenase component
MEEKWLAGLVKDLPANQGKAVVAVGAHLPPMVHALVHLINETLGSHGTTIRLTNPAHSVPVNQGKQIADLADQMAKGQITSLIILGGNPAYTAPADLKFAELIKKASFSAHVATHMDETSKACHWTLPQSHFLEAWGDGVAKDGTVSVVQPLIEPIYDSRSHLEVVDALLGTSRTGREIVSGHWFAAQSLFKGMAEVKASAPATAAPVTPAAPGAPAAAPGSSAVPTMAPGPLVESDFERAWRIALSEGVLIEGGKGSLPLRTAAGLGASLKLPQASGAELVLLPDPTIYDGRYANNMWLQEMPKPITNFTWDNCIYVNPAAAKAAGLERNKFLGIDGTQDMEKAALGMGRPMAEVTLGSNKLKAASAIQYGQADDTIVVHLGYGRTQGGSWVREADITHGGGFNGYLLVTTDAPHGGSGAALARSEGFYGMANVQFHNTLEAKYYDKDRNIIREAGLAAWVSGEPLFKHKEHHVPGVTPDHGEEKHEDGHAEKGHAPKHEPLTMWDKSAFKDYEKFNQWAMTIDLNLCTGCGACVMACQSENNVPSVGKREVQKGREMHWIRIDRYYMGTGDSIDEQNPPIRFMPMACVHCENAPCEPVCPVAATVHSHEGLNQMVYNRCVGTRYCSNNCPYKVRKFNFLHYTLRNDEIPVLQLLNNPDVTVRSRGVMEKCTYCVHRINRVRVNAKKDGREIADGEVVTACQAACPSQAIIFGDMRRPENAVSKSRASRRNYLLLEEANTIPRTTFLMRINNPNPEIEG